MNPLLEEYLVEEHQREIERGSSGRQVQGQTAKIYRPKFSTRVMRGFGQWMIEQGEELVKRCEVPAQNKRTSNRRYAH